MTLKELRIEKGLTQAACAKAVGIPMRTYVRYESDEGRKDTIKYRYIFETLQKYGVIDEDHGLLTVEKIREICSSRPCILIGRCGSYIFRDDPSCVKIFIYAGMDKKIQWIENQEKVSAHKARKLIEKVEEERAQFHKFYTGGNWGKVNDYDLCLDAGVTGTEKAADIILSYLESRGFTEHG